jgi:hypothetical protein
MKKEKEEKKAYKKPELLKQGKLTAITAAISGPPG